MVSKIARNIVNQSLRIKEDDVVHIAASRHMLDLADEIAVESRKAGAETTTVFWSEPVWYWSLEELPLGWLRGPSRTDLALLDVATAVVNLSGAADPKPMARISSERWAANSEGADSWYRKYLERKPRSASLALTSVTPQRARAYGFSYTAWKRSTENALKADYSRISATGKKLQHLFDNSNQEVHITASNGTDLSFRLAGRKSLMDDGIIDDSDLASGSFETTLPAGFINIAPDEQSANGSVVFDLPVPQRGKLNRGLSWHFKNGQVTKFVAAKNSEMVLPIWEGSTGDKSRFGSFGIGFNYAAKVGFLNSTIVSGAVTLGIGENKILGGKNQSTFGFQGTLRKSTVVIDGQTVVSEGKLAV
jgi:leucyl aminopeptidase (aminopeptidase T)